MASLMRRIKDIRVKYCNKCSNDCKTCRVKDFVDYIGIQLTSTYEIRTIMRTNLPTDVTHSSGKFRQNNRKVFK